MDLPLDFVATDQQQLEEQAQAPAGGEKEKVLAVSNPGLGVLA